MIDFSRPPQCGVNVTAHSPPYAGTLMGSNENRLVEATETPRSPPHSSWSGRGFAPHRAAKASGFLRTSGEPHTSRPLTAKEVDCHVH